MPIRGRGGLGQTLAALGLAAAILSTLAACISAESWEAVRVLQDIDSGAAPSALKSRTPEPERAEISFASGGAATAADLYRPIQKIGARLVLVPGFTPHGKNDARVVELATTLARARFLVLVPDIQGAREMRVRLDDAATIADAIRYLHELPAEAPHGIGVIAISYAVALALQAGLAPKIEDQLRFIVSLGGYHDTIAVIRFMNTGRYRVGPYDAWRVGAPHPGGRWVFLASHIDFLSDPGDRAGLDEIAERRRRRPDAPIDDLAGALTAEGRALLDLLTATDPQAIEALVAKLPGAIQGQIAALSPSRLALARLAGRLILIHGEDDSLVPPTESVALAAAAGRAELFLIPGFSHIDPRGVGLAGRLALIDAVQAILARRR